MIQYKAMEEKLTYDQLQKEHSDQKSRIAELERKVKAHESSELVKNRILEVFRGTSHLMAISDMVEGRYIDVNENFLRTLGYSRKELINKSSDDIQLFADIVQSDKFIKKLSRLKRVENFPVTLNTKDGEEKKFLFSAEAIFFGDDKYLLTTYIEDQAHARLARMENNRWTVVRELFESLSNFVLALSNESDEGIIVQSVNINSREFRDINPSAFIGKNLLNADIPYREVISEVVTKIGLTGHPEKLPLNPSGNDSEGYYLGINLASGDIIILWEPGKIEKSRESELLMQANVFEKFADMIPQVVFEIDTRGRVTYANSKGLERFGYSRGDIQNGLHVSSILGKDQTYILFNNLKKIQLPGSYSHDEYEVFSKDGLLIPVISHVYAVFNNQGKIIGYRGILTDMTDRKAIQDEIIREKTYLEVLIESAPESIVQTTLDGTIERINQEFTRVFGYTAEEAIGKNIDNLIIPKELIPEGNQFTLKAASNEPVSVETTRMTKSGDQIFVSLLIKPVRINDETTTLYAIYRNITEKKKDIETRDVILNISNAALTQNEFTDLYSIIQNELSRLWSTRNFYIVLYNSENETLSLPFYTDEKDDFTEIPAKGTLTGWLIRKREPVLLKVPDIDDLEIKGEIGLVGTPCMVWLGVPLIIEGEILGAMVLQDYESQDAFNLDDLRLLTLIGNQIALAIQRKHMMSRLILERAKAEEAARLKQQFMSTMSHEIRTPLNEVLGITNLLLQGNPRDDQMEFIKTLRFSGNHLLTLVNDVLDFNKMESGMIVFEKTQFNLSAFIGELKRSYSFRTEDKKLDFRLLIEDNVPVEVIGDPIRLNQVLSNLLSNAIKFTSEGFIELKVKNITKEGDSAELEFMVGDSGIGIPANKHELIFESYTQAADDTTRKFGGTGLGLSIVKRLIELQGGRVWVESIPDKGSRFFFTLSFAVAASDGVKDMGDDNRSEDEFDELQGKRILIAEDNKINFFVANKFLTKWGVLVTHAENGELALELINENSYDLILMDLHMPVMDGVEATRKIRESEREEISTMPVVALTAAIMSEYQDKIEGLNINDYILKPFKPRELYDKIKKHSR